MIFKLITQLVTNELHLGRLNPYNATIVFKTTNEISLNDKKRFCIILDLVRSLIAHSLLKQEGQNLSLFGITYSNLDNDQLMKILADNIPNTNDYFNFIFSKIDNAIAFKSIINKLDEKEIMKLFEDAERKLLLSK